MNKKRPTPADVKRLYDKGAFTELATLLGDGRKGRRPVLSIECTARTLDDNFNTIITKTHLTQKDETPQEGPWPSKDAVKDKDANKPTAEPQTVLDA